MLTKLILGLVGWDHQIWFN